MSDHRVVKCGYKDMKQWRVFDCAEFRAAGDCPDPTCPGNDMEEGFRGKWQEGSPNPVCLCGGKVTKHDRYECECGNWCQFILKPSDEEPIEMWLAKADCPHDEWTKEFYGREGARWRCLKCRGWFPWNWQPPTEEPKKWGEHPYDSPEASAAFAALDKSEIPTNEPNLLTKMADPIGYWQTEDVGVTSTGLIPTEDMSHQRLYAADAEEGETPYSPPIDEPCEKKEDHMIREEGKEE